MIGKGKEHIPLSEAQTMVQKATQGVFDDLKRIGHPFEAGQIDGEGHPITEERVKRIRRIIDKAGMELLGKAHTITED